LPGIPPASTADRNPSVSRSKKLDLNLLPIAVVLLEQGSVSKAALKLGMSQPSVSEALAKLRRYFNDPLFVRSREGMVPTPIGATIVQRAEAILRRIDDELLTDVAFEPALAERPFTFALSDVGEIVFLPRLLQRLRSAAPGAPVRSVSLSPHAVSEALEAGTVDLAIGYFPDLKKGQFYQQRLLSHHFVCLLRADHPVRSPQLDLKQFLALEHAVVQSEGRSQEIWERFLIERGVTRRIALTTPHFLSLPRIIARSDMVVTVPHAIGVAYGTPANNLRTVRPPFESPRIELRQHWHRRFHKDVRSSWLRQVVSELFSEATDEW
jgi:DNA-binding transcriptional LysR family regulator